MVKSGNKRPNVDNYIVLGSFKMVFQLKNWVIRLRRFKSCYRQQHETLLKVIHNIFSKSEHQISCLKLTLVNSLLSLPHQKKGKCPAIQRKKHSKKKILQQKT